MGVAFVELGWPGSNPKDAEAFARARDLSWNARDRGLRVHPPRRDVGRRRSPGGLAPRDRRARLHHLRQDVDAARARGPARRAGREPPYDRRHRRLPRRLRPARHLRRGALLRRLAPRPVVRDGDGAGRGRARGRSRGPLRHRTAARSRGTSRHGSAPMAEASPAASASTPTTTAAARVANSLAAVRAGARAGAGHDQRLRRALREREPHDHRPHAGAQDGQAVPPRGRARGRSRTSPARSPRSRTSRRTPTPLRRPQRLRSQGGDARRRHPPAPARVRARRPGARRQQAPASS